MQKYADFDEDGAPRAFYSEDVHGPLRLPVYGPALDLPADAPAREPPIIDMVPNPAYPPGVVAISHEAWIELVEFPGRRRWRDGRVETIEPPPLPAPVPPRIDRRQFFTQLALDGVITEGEAEETSSGSMPALLLEALAQIPDPAEAFQARMLVRNAATFERTHPLVAVLASHPRLRWDAARLDKLWMDASKL